MKWIIKNVKAIFWKILIYYRWMLTPFYKRGTGLGERVPDFGLLDFMGRKVTLSSAFPGKAVVLWLTNLCSSCEERIPLLQKVYEKDRDRIEIIAISTLGDDREIPEMMLKNHKIDFPLLFDPDDWIGKVLKFEHPPGACPLYNLLILDHSGRITLKHHLSAIKDDKFLEAIRKVGASD